MCSRLPTSQSVNHSTLGPTRYRQIFALAVEHEQLKRRVAVLEEALARLNPDLFDGFDAGAAASVYSAHLPAIPLPVPPPIPGGTARPTRRKTGKQVAVPPPSTLDQAEDGHGGRDGKDSDEGASEFEGEQDEYETDNEVVEGAAQALKGLGTCGSNLPVSRARS